ncbi:MAG: Iron-sulfur cluster carrier protein [Phycisphaerae bacterium]|nr:Iron-sulfur cluster carrier protein [Phycisphaerae bacterium]
MKLSAPGVAGEAEREMKLAVSGKGGVGKSTLSAALALLAARDGGRVLAVDADPDGNLASALGIPADVQAGIVPISQHRALIEQRTGAKVKQYGQMFKINPEVADIADGYALRHNGVALLVLGAIESGGSGCACPESVLIRALVQDLVLHKHDALVMDMEAGIEHLGRSTARGVDTLLVVVEPGQRSIDSARRVVRLAGEIGLADRVRFVANKVTGPDDERFIRDSLAGQELLGVIPFSPTIRSADRAGRSVLEGLPPELIARFESILEKVKQAAGSRAR